MTAWSCETLVLFCALITVVSVPRLHAQATLTWDGTGNNNSNWTTKQNWGNVDLAEGQNLIFAGGLRLSNNNNSTFGFTSISFSNIVGTGAFILGGNSVALGTGGLINNNTTLTQTVNLSLQLAGRRTFTTAAGGTTVITASISNGTSTGGVDIRGGGTMNFNATNGYSLDTSVGNGVIASRLNVNGSTSLTNAISVSSGSTLGGDGVINGNVTLASGSFLQVGNGGATDRSLQVGSLNSSGTLGFRVDGEVSTSRDVLTVSTGTVALGNSLLSLAFSDATVTNMVFGQSGTFLSNPAGYTGSSVYQILSGGNTGMFSNATTMTAADKSFLGLTGTQYTFTQGGQQFWIAQNPSANSMYLVAIPEPAVSLLGTLSVIGLVLRRRR